MEGFLVVAVVAASVAEDPFPVVAVVAKDPFPVVAVAFPVVAWVRAFRKMKTGVNPQNTRARNSPRRKQ